MADYTTSLTPEERTIVNILTYGTPAARQEVFVKLVYIGKVEVLQRVYDGMTDAEYWKFVPLA